VQYTKLGKTGLTISRICLGCMSYGDKRLRQWLLTEAEARAHFARALEAGINFFDTADVYSRGVSEQITGRWLREMANRDDVVVATKVCGVMAGDGLHLTEAAPNRGGLGRKHIIEACEASLKRLAMDYIDLYQIHRWDFGTPIEETLEALDALVRAGKVRYLGASSMAAWQFAKALFIARENRWHRLVSMQNHYNLVYREEEREMIPLCIDQGVGLIPWSPLARGFLSRARERGDRGESTVRARDDKFGRSIDYQQHDFDVLDAVGKIAAQRGVTNSQVALAWVLQAPGVDAPIVGTTKLSHLDEAIAALDLKLTGEEIAALEAPYRPHPILGYEPPVLSRMVK
jgi:aryl-alcohol dehydrogenase-like predicted oxidoreductase